MNMSMFQLVQKSSANLRVNKQNKGPDLFEKELKLILFEQKLILRSRRSAGLRSFPSYYT